MAMAFGKNQQGGSTLALGQCGERPVDRDALCDIVAGQAAIALVQAREGVRHRATAPPTAIEETPRRDGSQPSRKAAVAAPLADRMPRCKQGLLRQIVTVVPRQSPQVAPQGRFVGADQHGERSEVLPRRAPDIFAFLARAQGST